MKVSFHGGSTARSLVRAGRAIGRFFGPFPPAEPGARFSPDFRVHASYGRFVFSMHALAPRQEPLSQADVHDAIQGSQVKQMALIAKTNRQPGTASSSS